jgi:hypothetical protein
VASGHSGKCGPAHQGRRAVDDIVQRDQSTGPNKREVELEVSRYALVGVIAVDEKNVD